MLNIIGLGNPGDEYENTRHNTGRSVVLTLAEKEGLRGFQKSKNVPALISADKIGKTKVRLVLPETFMNKSGKAIEALKLKPKDILLIHDDSDLPLGRMKFSFGKRSAGHKGVESAKRALKTWDFWRLRIGIQKKKRVPAGNLVLMKFSPKEQKEFKKVLEEARKATMVFATKTPERAMSEFNNS